MEDLFKAYKELSENDYKSLWKNAVFIFDANVLLDLYRLPESARKDLFAILESEKVNKRIWLPFQVSLEFINNRLDVISEQKNKFSAVKEIIRNGLSQIGDMYGELQKKMGDLQLKKRHSVINPDKYINDQLFRQSAEILNEFSSQLDNLDKKQPDVNDIDEIKSKIFEIFKNKVGTPMNKDFLEKMYAEGENRYKENIPPGFKDKEKEGFYLYLDSLYKRKFGDLILWQEVIEESKKKQWSYIILVTGDTKEDWWQTKRGKKIGPRYELLNEIYTKSESVKIFHMYDTSLFMLYAKQYLDIDVNKRSIEETKDIIEYSKVRSQELDVNEGYSLERIIDNVISLFPDGSIIVSNELGYNANLQLSRRRFQLNLMDLLANVKAFSVDGKVSLDILEINNELRFRFRTYGDSRIIPDKKTFGVRFRNTEFGRVIVHDRKEFYKEILNIDMKYVINAQK